MAWNEKRCVPVYTTANRRSKLVSIVSIILRCLELLKLFIIVQNIVKCIKLLIGIIVRHEILLMLLWTVMWKQENIVEKKTNKKGSKWKKKVTEQNMTLWCVHELVLRIIISYFLNRIVLIYVGCRWSRPLQTAAQFLYCAKVFEWKCDSCDIMFLYRNFFSCVTFCVNGHDEVTILLNCIAID